MALSRCKSAWQLLCSSASAAELMHHAYILCHVSMFSHWQGQCSAGRLSCATGIPAD